MKKIINGFRYDTDTAERVCSVFTGTGHSDFTCIDADLYRTKRSKTFFLAGWGGAMTVFSRTCGDGSCCGQSTIVPISQEDARKFAEKHGTAEVVERFFKIQEA